MEIVEILPSKIKETPGCFAYHWATSRIVLAWLGPVQVHA
jgi:hypothetical protein